MTNKSLIDVNGKTIERGTIVRYGDSWYRVTSVSVKKKTVNLSNVFLYQPFIKNIALSDVYEDEDAWYKNWQQSEHYQCM